MAKLHGISTETNSTKQSEMDCKCLHDSIFETHYMCKLGKHFDYSQQRTVFMFRVGIYIIPKPTN